MTVPLTIHTVGHSTRSSEEFVALLRAHAIELVADVRTVPRSRRHPHFAAEALDTALAAAGMAYRHFPELGGLRKPKRDSPNTAWRHPSFRGYADHMQTDTFRRGLAALESAAATRRTVVMCAEAVWWQCHRRLLADALLVRDVRVLHILTAGAPNPHELSDFARVEAGRVTYPGLV